MHTSEHYVYCSWVPEEGVTWPGTGDKGGCESYVSAENQSSSSVRAASTVNCPSISPVLQTILKEET